MSAAPIKARLSLSPTDIRTQAKTIVSDLTHLALTGRDFDLLAPALARSAEYNPERLELRRRLAEAGRRHVAALAQRHELDLDVHTSLHHPASFNAFKVDELRLYFSRGKRARTELRGVLGGEFKKDIDSAYHHGMLLITLRQEGLRVSFSIHPEAWWDAQNLAGKCARGENAADFARVVNATTGFTLQIHEHRPHKAGSIYRDEIERALRHWKVGEHYLKFFRDLPRDEALALSAAALEDRLIADLMALAPTYLWILWSPANDFLFRGKIQEST